mgnify:CR=1 FL=1
MFFSCPHCNGEIQVEAGDVCCGIFRHAVLKKNFTQVNPHEKKSILEDLKKKDLIYGCGKPSRFDGKKIEICDYI